MTPDNVARPASMDAVLDYAWGAREFTATDVIENIEVTRSTAISAVDALVELGLLRELPNARDAGQYRMGRPARRFAFQSDAGVVVGVDAGHTHLAVTVADLAGEVKHRLRRELDPQNDSPTERRTEIGDAVDAALQGAGRGRDDLVAICVGVPAPVDKHGRSPQHPDGFWARMNPDLADAFGPWAPLVRIENDASLAAVAEGSIGAAVGCSDYVALLAGQRFGAGVVVDGSLLRGRHGGVGEMIAFDHVTGVETAEGLGHQISGWARSAVEDGSIAPSSALGSIPADELDARRVLELAAAGDTDARKLADRAGQMLARVVSVLGSMFDPQRVVVTGAVADGIAVAVDKARDALPTDLDLPVPELVVSSLGADVVVEGALHAAVDLARERALDLFLASRSQNEAATL